MLRAAVVGLGWWGETLVDAVAVSADIRVVAAFTRSRSARDQQFARDRGLWLADDMAEVLGSPDIDAVILATPPSGHGSQILAAVAAGKHVFCEKPLTVTRQEAVAAVEAAERAKVVLGLGYNRRFHPCWADLKRRMRDGSLGTILHLECTLSGPNSLTAAPGAWRAQPAEAPCGGLYPMGVHAIDGLVDLAGPISGVFCRSVRRAAPGANDDTTSMLFEMEAGMTAYVSTMTATAASFRFNVYGSKAAAFLSGMTHVGGQSSHQRRAGLFSSYVIQPVMGPAEEHDVEGADLNRAELEAFARAAVGGAPYPIPPWEMVHVVAATEAVVESARTGLMTAVS
jgi:predicted dehydrogenase